DIYIAAARRDDGARRPAERLAAPGSRRLPMRADRQQQFAGGVKLGDGVRAVVHAPDRAVGRDRDAVRAGGEDALAEAALKAPVGVEFDDRMLDVAGEREDV